MIEGVGGIVREITGTVVFGVCKVKGKNVDGPLMSNPLSVSPRGEGG